MLLNTTTNFRVICEVISEKWPKKHFLLNAEWERTPTGTPTRTPTHD